MQAMEKIPTDINPNVSSRPGAASVAIGVGPQHNGAEGPHQKPRPKVISDNINDKNGLPLGRTLLPIAVA